MTSVTTLACLQKLALCDASPALNCQLHVHRWVLFSLLQGEYWKIFALGIGLENPDSRDRIGQYYSASRDGHQIHPPRVTRIDSVKINPSLVMMREWRDLFIIITTHLFQSSVTFHFFAQSTAKLRIISSALTLVSKEHLWYPCYENKTYFCQNIWHKCGQKHNDM